jgi:hypothetical protein
MQVAVFLLVALRLSLIQTLLAAGEPLMRQNLQISLLPFAIMSMSCVP